MSRRLLALSLCSLVLSSLTLAAPACAGRPPGPLARTVAAGTARFELTVARGPSVARSAGVLDLRRRRAHVQQSAGLADGPPAGRIAAFDLAEWVEGATLDTDGAGRIRRLVFNEADVVVTLELRDFGAAVPSARRGT